MPILKSPLLSLDARGSIGRALTLLRLHRKSIAKAFPTHPDVQSPLQLAQRARFATCNLLWNALTDTQKDIYRHARYPPNLTGHQRYIRLCLRNQVPPPPGPLIDLWLPDAPPASPSPYDDEFADPPLDLTKWALWDPPASTSVTQEPYGLSLLQTTTPGNSWAGIFQSLPPGDFTFYTKVSLSATRDNTALVALLLAQDLALNPNTADLAALTLTVNLAGTVSEFLWYLDFQTFAASWGWMATSYPHTTAYLRLSYTPPNVHAAFSLDGFTWLEFAQRNLPFPPASIALATNNVGMPLSIRAIASFFRYVPSYDPLQILHGDRLIVGWPHA